MLDKLTVDDFRPARGQAFSVDAGQHGEVSLILAGVRALGSDDTPGEGQRVPFALDFRGPVEPILPQATYRLENGHTGALEIFMVPVGQTAEGTDYEAIFT